MTIEAPLELNTPMLAPDRAVRDAGEYLLPDLCAEQRWYRRTWLGVAIVIFALYAMLVFSYWGAGDSGVDQNAYLTGGRLLAQHFSLKYTLPNPYAYTGGMFVRMPDGTYYPKYPFGLPLLYASFFWLFKVASVLPILKHHVDPNQAAYWAFLVSPISAVAGVAGTFFLARQIAGSFAGAMAAILLGSSQLMMMLADNPNSHASCLAFIVWGMFFCVRWLQTGSIWRGILGGLLVGYAATIRYNEGLLFLAMCVVVLSRLQWNQWKNWRSVTSVLSLGVAIGLIVLQFQNASAAAVGDEEKWSSVAISLNILAISALCVYGLTTLVFSIINLGNRDWTLYLRALVPGFAWAVPVGIMLMVNHHTMGSFTGYDSTHESEFGAAFQWKFFWQNWEKAIRIFDDVGLFFVLPFAIAGVAMLFRRSWRIGLMLVLWIVPGVILYMSYYWSPDRSEAYARFFLTYLPALCVGAAFCFHEGLLVRGHESRRPGGAALTISVGVVVAMASGISMYRTIHGLRDGSQEMKIPLHDFRERLSLAQTGQVLLDKVPEHSVLFAEDAGGIASTANYLQFIRDWELFGIDAFSLDGARKGGGPAGGNRGRNNRGGGGGRNNNFNGGGGGPPGGGFGGPPGGGFGGGNNANAVNANALNDPNAAVATPVQPEQREYKASLYKGKTARQLYQMEADLINQALSQGRKVFVVAGKDHALDGGSGNLNFLGGGGGVSTDPMEGFRDDLGEAGRFQFKVVSRWQDVSIPEGPDDDFALTDNSPMGGGGGGNRMGNQFARRMMSNDRVMDWELVEVRAK